MNKLSRAGLLGAVAMGCVAAQCFAGMPKKWNEVPKAVQATILANGGQAGTVDLEGKQIDGAAVYEAPAKDKNGKMVDLVVLEDGKLLKVKTDAEEDAAKDQGAEQPAKKGATKGGKKAPPAEKEAEAAPKADVKLTAAAEKTFKKAYPKGEITKLSVDVENNVTVYDIEFKNGAVEMETDIAADGTMLEYTVVIPAKEVPQAAMKAVKKAAKGATLGRIERIEISYDTEDGKALKKDTPVTHYAIETTTKDGKMKEIVVTADGALVTEEKAAGGKGSIDGYVSEFAVEKANLASVGTNPYFIPLVPGTRYLLEGEGTRLTVIVTQKTKVVDGVETRVVEEREEKDGKPIEIAQNYFAIDKTTKAVYYFGEDVDMYKDGKVVNHDGSWLSGVNAAKFGLMMPGEPKAGDKFQQEIAPKVAMDRCELVSVTEEVKTPAGTFKNCVKTKDSSAMESGTSSKFYAPGVGLVKDDEFVLVKIFKGGK